MSTLQNPTSQTVRWRTFDQGAIGTLVAASEVDLSAGASRSYVHPKGAFYAEVRAAVGVTTPWTPVLAALAGPFTNTDTLAFDGHAIQRVTAAAPVRQLTPFQPSRHGFQFSNSWPRNVPHLTLDIGVHTRGLFDAGMGLCGGMVYAALDYFATGARPALAHPPGTGALFDFLCRRLTDSFGGLGGIARYLSLMHPTCTAVQRARTMVVDEWPQIRTRLDGGLPVPLALVLVESADAFDLGLNHQVLATGYELDGLALSLHLYDPNRPGRDDLRLTLDLGGVNGGNTQARLSADGCPVRAFFRTDYQPQTPPPAAQVPAGEPPLRPDLSRGGSGWVEGNGYLGLLQLGVPAADGRINGTVYGQALTGRWLGDEIEFVRTIAAGYDQVWRGRRHGDGAIAGDFVERRNGLIQPGIYAWRAHGSLALDGNGWAGDLALDRFFGNGDFSGRAYGQPVSGHWDAAAQCLSFVRELGAGYQQVWTASRTHGLDFDGRFQERVNGTLQARTYRWLGRWRTQAGDTVQVDNRLGRAIRVRLFAPDDAVRSASLCEGTVAAGGRRAFTIPLGLPLALTHVRVVVDGVGDLLAGYGDELDVRPDGTVRLA